MNRQEKQEFVEEVNNIFTKANSVLVAHYQGLTVSDITILRNKLRQSGAKFKVVKNNLAKIALNNTKCKDLEEHFSGPTAIAYSDDPIAASKGIVEFSKENEKLKIIAGIVEGNLIDSNGIIELSKMPSIDELRATIVGLLTAPASNLANYIQAPAKNLAGTFDAYANSEK